MDRNGNVYEKTVLEPHEDSDEEDKTPKKEMKLNDFFKLGWYTALVMVMMKLIGLNMIGNAFYMMFASAAPKIVSCGEHSFSNASDIVESCKMLQEVLNTEHCTPEFSYQFRSINVEWNYYCDSTKIVKSSITYQMTGLMIGAVVFGQISDNYGRKKALLLAMTFNNLFILASSFSTNLINFTVLRFFVNIFNAGCISVLPIYAMELLPPKHRFWINNIVGGAPLVIIAAGMAYFSGDWRTYARVIASLGIVAITACCCISESPRFLIQKGRTAEAKRVVKRMFKIDRRKYSEEMINSVLDKENKAFLEKQTTAKKYTFLHLFYTPSLTRYALSIGLTFFTTSMMTYALMFNLENIAGSLYLNLVLTGVVRYIAGGIMSLLEMKCPSVGRKTIHFGVLFVAASCLLTFFIINLLDMQSQYALLLRAMALIILGFIAQIYLIASICATELFPTAIRNLSFSFGQFLNRIGVILSPQVFFLAETWHPLPYLAMFSLVFFNMLFFQVNVKETKNNPLGDHMPGPEESWCGRKKSKNRPNLSSPFDENNEKLIGKGVV